MSPDGDVAGYRVTRGPGLERAIDAVRHALLPLGLEDIKRGVAMLSARCSVPGQDAAVKAAALVEALAEMPADLAADVIANWHRENEWMPTAAQVWKRHGWRVKQRQMLLQALEGAAC